MDHIGWPTAVVAGASMGGCVSLAFAAAYPARTSGLGLFDTTAGYGPEAPQQWAERADRALANGLEDLVSSRRRAGSVTGFGPSTRTLRSSRSRCSWRAIVRPMRRRAGCWAPAMSAQRCRACRFRSASLLARRTMPLPSPWPRRSTRESPGSSLTILQSARHLTPLETPDRIAAEIDTLLAATDQR